MGTATFGKSRCSDCGIELDELPDSNPDQRQPCPNCGSLKRVHKVTFTESLQVHGSLKAKGRHAGKRKPFIEIFSGSDFSRRLRKWLTKFRLIDRDNDRYQELVTDPDTGEIIHESNEKLSDHTGHGSDKK